MPGPFQNQNKLREEENMRTLQEIKDCEKEMLTPEDVARVLGCKAYNINLQAKKDPKALGFPVIMVGTRVKIPRRGFIRFMEGLPKEASA